MRHMNVLFGITWFVFNDYHCHDWFSALTVLLVGDGSTPSVNSLHQIYCHVNVVVISIIAASVVLLSA